MIAGPGVFHRYRNLGPLHFGKAGRLLGPRDECSAWLCLWMHVDA